MKSKLMRSAVVALAFVAALAPSSFMPSLRAQETSTRTVASPLPATDQEAVRPLPIPEPRVPEEAGPPSPLIGMPPPLRLSWPQWQRVQKNPDLLQQMQSGLPPVSSTPAPAPPPTSPWQLGPFAPGNAPLSNPLLLTDGTVIAHVSCTGTWWRLTPDITGNYATGSWSQIASLPSGYTPRFFSSAVLPDGRVIIEGGEYNTNCKGEWTTLGAIYDPLTDVWTLVTPPSGWTTIGDSQAIVLANGVYSASRLLRYSPQGGVPEPEHSDLDSDWRRQVRRL